jgi:predicted RNA-binding protein YlqC (UPF0109 family)
LIPGSNRSSYFLTADQRDIPLKSLIKHIVQELVDHPEQVTISEIEGTQSMVLEIKVAKEDIGKIIGRQGRTAQAIRTILNAVSAKAKKRTTMEIIE